ncbi:uncharacterized protein LOC115632676 [Scaptodrosophila lebanonensis]|uniref:Uncharacterized protein LOC115632676 n=1 Tax=Drosophila lebanonensis TaxID=7225 RepID=A0A6J2UCH2_DROLE|nr:uncharacterized protein LOC115632676 [Scaptodrosophila lebanonensis]
MAHAENTSQNMCCCVWGERMLGSQMPLSRKLNNDDSTYADDSDELGLFSEFIISGSEKQELVISYLLNFEKDNLNRKYAHVVPNMGIHNVALSPNNSTISAVSLDGILTLLDVVNGVKIANVSHNFVSNIWSTAFGKDDNCVFAGSAMIRSSVEH